MIFIKQIIYYDNKNIIHRRLKEARTERGISQSDLAAKMQLLNVNIDQQMISKIEKNQRQVTDYELTCICKCLNVSIDWMTQDFFNDWQPLFRFINIKEFFVYFPRRHPVAHSSPVGLIDLHQILILLYFSVIKRQKKNA